MPFPRIFWLFCLFIFACGTTHLIEAIIFWEPIYRFSAGVKAVTAAASWATVFALVPVMPQALKFPAMSKLVDQLEGEVRERQKTEDSLRLSEQRYRTLVEATASVVWTTDAAGRFVARQPSFEEFTGMTWEEYEGDGWIKAIHEDDREGIAARWATALAACEPYEATGRMWCAQAQAYHHFIARGAPVLNDDGSIREWIGTVTDIHNQHIAEEKLRDQEARFSAVVNTAVDAIITITDDGRVDTVNLATEQMFGYSAQELIGEKVNSIMPPPYADEHDQYLTNYLTTDERKIIGVGREVLGLRKDGTVFPLDLAVSEMSVGGQRMFTGIARDITQRKQTELRLQSALVEVERRDTERRDFFSILAHDLKHPVISVQGLLGLIEADCGQMLPADARENLKLATSEAERMKQMLVRINELVRIDLVEIRSERVRLIDVAQRVADRFRPRLARQNVTLSIDAPDIQAAFASHLVEEALTNLVDNALNYGCPEEGGSIQIVARIEDGKCRMVVQDNGPGIDPRHHARVFEPFRRLSRATGVPGSGIGLTAVRRVMQRMGGDVELVSEVGEGARFSLVFPVL